MKTLSAVNIRQYEKAVESLDNYLHTIELGLQVVLKDHAIPSLAPGNRTSSSTWSLVVFGSDQGLCGHFNKKLVEFVIEACQIKQLETLTPRFLVIGGRLAERLETAGFIIDEYFETPNSIHSINKNVFQILLVLEKWQSNHVDLFFNQHAAGSGGKPYQRPLLPIDNKHLQHIKKKLARPQPAHIQHPAFAPVYRPDPSVSLCQPVQGPDGITGKRTGQPAAVVAERGKNIKDHLEELKTDFQIKRQAAITSELLDIVAGFKAATGIC